MSCKAVSDASSAAIVLDLVRTIDDNAALLSEVDGAIGDGDHGINMRKGFDRFASIASEKKIVSASEAFQYLGTTLMTEIGGSMGPLYGSFFRAMGKVAQKAGTIDTSAFLAMLKAGAQSVMDIGEARRGDKTMLDTLLPSIDTFEESMRSGADFIDALQAMSVKADESALTTKNMVAKVGRAARLGDRSRGFQDAGATSCSFILQSMAKSITTMLSWDSCTTTEKE